MLAVKIFISYCSKWPEFYLYYLNGISVQFAMMKCLESTDLDEDSVNICKLKV